MSLADLIVFAVFVATEVILWRMGRREAIELREALESARKREQDAVAKLGGDIRLEDLKRIPTPGTFPVVACYVIWRGPAINSRGGKS